MMVRFAEDPTVLTGLLHPELQTAGDTEPESETTD
jgi:hypothetical protein